MSAPSRYLALRFIVVFLTALSLIDLLWMLLIVGYHAYHPAAVATGILAPMTFILAGASSAAGVLALAYALLSYPAYRKTLFFLTLIILGIFGAHLYTINLPALYTTHSLSGQIGGTARDDVLTMSSTLSGSSLSVTVADTGGDAIGSLSVAVGDTALPSSGFKTVPTPTEALQPGSQDAGSWSLQPNPSPDISPSATRT